MLTDAYIKSLIQQEIDKGIPSERIVIGGFSQGGSMAILSGLTAKVKLGGIVALSSWLLLSKKFKQLVPAENFNRATPVFMAHGTEDVLVQTALGRLSYETLKGKEMGYDVTWKEYE